MATKNEMILQEMGLRGPSDSLSYRVAVRSIERVADLCLPVLQINALRLQKKYQRKLFKS